MPTVIVPHITFEITIGASFSETLTWRDENGTLVPLPSGTTVEIKVRSSLASGTVLARFSTSPGATEGLITVTNPGLITLAMTAANTAQLAPIEKAFFDVKYTFPSGLVTIKLDDGRGLFKIKRAVTR